MTALTVRGLRVAVPGRVLLSGVDLSVQMGECVVVMGRSGSGKTTLLHCLAGIKSSDSGEVWVGEHRLDSLSVAQRARRRLHDIGLVFQFGELLPELSVLENVSLPALLAGVKRTAAEARSEELLATLGLAGMQEKATPTLSGGEAQRVAIARALVNRPTLVLADEPTGALDERNAETVGAVLIEAARVSGAAVVIATHDLNLARLGDRQLHFEQGQLVGA